MTERPTNTQTDRQHKHVPAGNVNSTEKHVHSTMPHKNEKTEEKKVEDIKSEEKVTKKEVKKNTSVVKKEEAIAYGHGLAMSLKHSMYISKFIKNKSIDKAIEDLIQVTKIKKIVPFKGEIPHRKGKGMMSGRYPVFASRHFISVLKGLKGNVIANGMDLDRTTIYYSNPSWASRPMRRGGVHAKRVNILIKAKENKEIKKNG